MEKLCSNKMKHKRDYNWTNRQELVATNLLIRSAILS